MISSLCRRGLSFLIAIGKPVTAMANSGKQEMQQIFRHRTGALALTLSLLTATNS